MSDSLHVDVCVVGGGLGGLALAIALQELGLRYVVCEAADELRTGRDSQSLQLLQQACNCQSVIECVAQDASQQLMQMFTRTG